MALCVALPCVWAAACGPAGRPDEAPKRTLDPAARESVVLITLDTTRFDGVGFAGGPPGWTPNLDKLAEQGISFDQARTVAPLTAPAHASILTGLYPPRHGVRANGVHVLPEEATTLAEHAETLGFETAAFIAAVVLDDVWGLDQGFAVYDEPTDTKNQGGTFGHRSAPDVIASALQWLEARDSARPFFLWVHLFDPHEPYDAEPRFYEQVHGERPETYDRYYAEIAEMDHHLGALLAKLDEDRTARPTIAVVADHGESLGFHGEGTHGPFVYDMTMRVPMLVRFADGAQAGQSSDAITSVVDLFPTLLHRMGLQSAGDVDGRDLAGPIGVERGVYFETYYGYASYGWAPLAGWADAAGKYIHGPKPQFFDTSSDPAELKDLYDAQNSYESYRSPIAAVIARTGVGGAGGGSEVDAQLLEGIRALGYAETAVSSGFPSPLAATERPAPRDQLGEMEATIRALILQNRGNFAEAAEKHRQILASNPYNAVTLERLGFCSIQLQDYPSAVDCYRRYLEFHPQNATVRQNLGTCLLRSGQQSAALEEWRRALELDPDHGQTLTAAARLARALGQTSEALGYEKRLESLD